MLLTIIKTLLCLLTPGAALLLVQNTKKWAFAVPAFGLAIVIIFGVSRIAVEPLGFLSMLISLSMLHFLSLVIGLYLHLKRYQKAKGFGANFVGLCILNITIAVSCHLYKANWFGFSFYHIPSVSMQPALQPGDIVVVDNWVYQENSLQVEDIIIFKRPQNDMVMIKRIKKLRSGYSSSIFVEGDNPNKSFDSRRFGWLDEDSVLGKATFILINIQQCQASLINCKPRNL